MLIINSEGRETKGLSKGRYDETFVGEDGVAAYNLYKQVPCFPVNSTYVGMVVFCLMMTK